ncbi:hypothetical protein MINS_15620 [Mycolicibacterium insubricum]|jgi:pimeloyl-ACP methyl ester carboxylesterase|uniref:alpha/beta fold hydrolase n=1 Tax=Mycolicibacterium insubricum TaxID=444597 RepID=UPI001056D5EA|nr:alpha/beta hydrolase [Mycolicibacterium insubricum]MCV7080494.1 alpha/beta hydrolase [Mycolicibacterium insubricum]BBZ66133.1 hypothetical protein MINS_15620 [Mycolicibacterium insubricum]
MHAIVDLIVAGAHEFRGLGSSPAPSCPSDAELKSVTVPTLVILSGRSRYHDAHGAATRARQHLMAGEVEIWPAASHSVAAEFAPEVDEAILRFIGRADQVARESHLLTSDGDGMQGHRDDGSTGANP